MGWTLESYKGNIFNPDGISGGECVSACGDIECDTRCFATLEMLFLHFAGGQHRGLTWL